MENLDILLEKWVVKGCVMVKELEKEMVTARDLPRRPYGSVIITGARSLEQIYTAYNFINEIFERHQDELEQESAPLFKRQLFRKTKNIYIRKENILGLLILLHWNKCEHNNCINYETLLKKLL